MDSFLMNDEKTIQNIAKTKRYPVVAIFLPVVSTIPRNVIAAITLYSLQREWLLIKYTSRIRSEYLNEIGRTFSEPGIRPTETDNPIKNITLETI